MKIVQTFWTKPFAEKHVDTKFHRLNGGWPSSIYFMLSWAYSFQTIKKIYPDICLVTDALGKSMLVDSMELNYSACSMLPSELAQFDAQLWALPKIFAYEMQEQPFIHMDGDVFIWNDVFARFHEDGNYVQNVERDISGCENILNVIQKEFNYVPSALYIPEENRNTVSFVNAGILGSTDLAFIHRFCKEGKMFVSKNRAVLNKIDAGLFNVIFEQLLFYRMCRAENIPIHELLDQRESDRVEEIYLTPAFKSYVHLAGDYKKDLFACNDIALRLSHEFPENFRCIANWCKSFAEKTDWEVFNELFKQHESRQNPHYSFIQVSTPEMILSTAFKLRDEIKIEIDKVSNEAYACFRSNKDNVRRKLINWERILVYFSNWMVPMDIVYSLEKNNFCRDIPRAEVVKRIGEIVLAFYYRWHYIEIAE